MGRWGDEMLGGLLLFLLRSAVTCQVCLKFALDAESKQGGRGSSSGAESIENHARVLYIVGALSNENGDDIIYSNMFLFCLRTKPRIVLESIVYMTFLKILSIQRTFHHLLNTRPNPRGFGIFIKSYVVSRTLKCSR